MHYQEWSCARQKLEKTLSDAWESTNWEGLGGTPWQMVAPKLKLTKNVTADRRSGTPIAKDCG